MDYLLLETFLTVVQSGSFSKAADNMHCVQSNITARVKRLEEHFGQAVFERGRGGARLTEFGRQLEIQAIELVSAHKQAENELMNAAGQSAKFHLGSMETTAATHLPKLLQWLNNEYPQTQLSLRTGPTGELATMVWDRHLDAAFVAGPVDEKRFRKTAAFDERLMIARPIKGQQSQSLLAFRSACSYRNIAAQWLRSTGNMDTHIIEMGTLDAMLGCVEAGIGFAIFPESALRAYRHFQNVDLQPLASDSSYSTTFLIWRNDHKPSLVHQSVLQKLQENYTSQG